MANVFPFSYRQASESRGQLTTGRISAPEVARDRSLNHEARFQKPMPFLVSLKRLPVAF